MGKGAEGFDVSADGNELWTAKPDGTVAVVDLENRKVIAYLNTQVAGLHRLKFTPDGRYVCIVSVLTGDLLWFDSKTRKEVKRINVGQGAAMLMDKAKNRLFISCTPNNYIAVVDLNAMKLTKKLQVGGRPDGLTISILK